TKPINPALDDVRYAGQCLDIVDDGRLAKQALYGRKGWLDSRPSPLPFEAFQEACLFAANVRARTAVQINVERKIGPQDVLPEEAIVVTLADGPIERAIGAAELVAEIDISGVAPDGVGRNDDSLEDLMRIVLHQDAVIESAGFAFVSVDAQIDRAGMILGQE